MALVVGQSARVIKDDDKRNIGAEGLILRRSLPIPNESVHRKCWLVELPDLQRRWYSTSELEALGE